MSKINFEKTLKEVIQLKKTHPSLKKIEAKYKLKKLVGQGQYGLVVKAKNHLKERVAIKFVEDILSDEMMTRSVIREIQILR